MQKFNCLVVDDEPLAAEVLEDYINDVPFLQFITNCSDAIAAMEVLRKEEIDLIFLDIHLPKLKGIDFLKTLIDPPKVIITTAYHDYALQGYELNVLDYLLKPIEFSRFVTAVNKLKQAGEIVPHNTPRLQTGEREFLFFNVGKKKVRMFLDEILYIESLKEYVKIISKEKSIVTKFPLGEMEELLKKNNFLRTHRSFIVARDKIEAFSATDVEINGKQIPIGRSYKEQVTAALE